MLFWRVDRFRPEESVDFSPYGFVKIFAFLKFWKTKDRKDVITCPLCRVTPGRMSRSQEQDEFIAVRVQDPRVQNDGSWNSYVDFKIFLHTNSKAFTAKTSCVRRRYSEFVWLKKKLQKNAGLVPVPDLPKKSFFSFFNDDFIERRRKGLQSFLDKVVHMTVCLSDSQLHLFLQTQLPVKHIEDCVQGHTPYTVTEAILTYASSNRGWVQEEGTGSQELWSAPVPYESAESPAPHLPSLQSPGATARSPNDPTAVSHAAHDDRQGNGHEPLSQEEESSIKLVVEEGPNLAGSVETEEEGEGIGSNDAKDLQINLEVKPIQQDSRNEDPDEETSAAVDVCESSPGDDLNEANDVGLEVNNPSGRPSQTEEEPEVRIHDNEVTLDLSAVQDDSAERHKGKELEHTLSPGEVLLHGSYQENAPITNDQDEEEIKEGRAMEEDGDEEHRRDAAVHVNEEHLSDENELNAKYFQPDSDILVLGGAVNMQNVFLTENLNANTADVNKLVLQAIDIDSVQCQETDTPTIITAHPADRY